MITKRKKRSKAWQAILFSLISAIFIFGVIGFLIFYNWQISQRRTGLTERIEGLKAEIEFLEKRKKELEASASKAGQESHLEEVAREQLNLKKPGEEVVTILAPEQEEKEALEEKNFWQRILEKIGF